MYFNQSTVEDEILARVILGKIVPNTFWQIKYWQISHASMHIPMQKYNWRIKY